MLLQQDPFRDLDRFSRQVFGTAARPTVMPLDAWREGDDFVVELDLPGVRPERIDIDVERNVLTVRAERAGHLPRAPTPSPPSGRYITPSCTRGVTSEPTTGADQTSCRFFTVPPSI